MVVYRIFDSYTSEIIVALQLTYQFQANIGVPHYHASAKRQFDPICIYIEPEKNYQD